MPEDFQRRGAEVQWSVEFRDGIEIGVGPIRRCAEFMKGRGVVRGSFQIHCSPESRNCSCNHFGRLVVIPSTPAFASARAMFGSSTVQVNSFKPAW